MKSFIVIIIALVAAMFATVAADTTTVNTVPTTPTIKISMGVAMLTPFDIRGINYYPVGYSVGFGLSTPVSPKMTAGAEIGIKTNMSTFQPNPQVVVSASYKVSDKFSLGCGMLYRYLARFPGMENDGHFLSAILVPGFQMTGFTLATPIAVDYYNSISRKVSGTFAVKLIFPLAAF